MAISFTGCLQHIILDANKLDRDSSSLQQALHQLGKRELLALKVPTELGGKGLEPLEYGEWQIAIAKHSGALAFLQTQHQSAGSFLAKSSNTDLQRTYLPSMATGEKLLGVGFSQLRRLGKPLVTATPVKGGYELSGVVPWVTGGNIFEEFVIGSSLPDGRELYGIVPLQNKQNQGKVTVSKPMDLMVMSATNTVSVELDRWYLPSELVVDIKPAGQIHRGSQKNVLHHSWFPLGCAYSALDIMVQTYQKKQLDAIWNSKTSLERELKQHHLTIKSEIAANKLHYQQKLLLRAKAIDLAFRCAQGAVIATSGSANSYQSDAGRVYREALVFSVSGQTADLLSASLNAIAYAKS